MAKKFDMVKDVNGNWETLKLRVWINDLWEVENRDVGKHIEMILVDDKVLVDDDKARFKAVNG